jgi:hypothetical protein
MSSFVKPRQGFFPLFPQENRVLSGACGAPGTAVKGGLAVSRLSQDSAALARDGDGRMHFGA